jgi:hypothetical protein
VEHWYVGCAGWMPVSNRVSRIVKPPQREGHYVGWIQFPSIRSDQHIC